MARGYRNVLTEKSFYKLSPQDTSEHLVEKYERLWQNEQRKARPSLLRAFVRGGAWMLFWTFFVGALEMAVQIGSAVFIGYLVRFFSDFRAASTSGQPSPSANTAYLYAMGLSLTSLATVFTHHILFWLPVRLSLKLKVAAIGMVYKKALRLSSGALQHTTAGQIANLISNEYTPLAYVSPYCCAFAV